MRATSTPRNSESGMAMVLVITVLAALLAVGAIGLSLQLNSTKSASLVKDSRSALYCAEAGLASARNLLTTNRSIWNDLLNTTVKDWPTWYPITGDIDGDGELDYSVTIVDDGEVIVGADADSKPFEDSNGVVIVTSVCTKYLPEAPSEVIEVITMQVPGHTYRNQSGQGAGNTGNAN